MYQGCIKNTYNFNFYCHLPIIFIKILARPFCTIDIIHIIVLRHIFVLSFTETLQNSILNYLHFSDEWQNKLIKLALRLGEWRVGTIISSITRYSRNVLISSETPISPATSRSRASHQRAGGTLTVWSARAVVTAITVVRFIRVDSSTAVVITVHWNEINGLIKVSAYGDIVTVYTT